MRHPFVIFTDFVWIWVPLYGAGAIIGVIALAASENTVATFFLGGVVGSMVIISFWCLILWMLTQNNDG